MARVATDLGAKIFLNEPVQSILLNGRRAMGIRTATRQFEADAAIINADFARAMSRLTADALRRRRSNRKLAKKRFSCSTFMLYLGLEGCYTDIPHHTIFIAEDYRRNLDEIENQHVLSEDLSLYVQNACVTDPRVAPAGMSTLYVLAPVTHQHPNVDWDRQRQRYRSTVLRQLAQDRYRGYNASDSLRTHADTRRLGSALRNLSRRNIQPGAQLPPVIASQAA